jgi:hypothetical protein
MELADLWFLNRDHIVCVNIHDGEIIPQSRDCGHQDHDPGIFPRRSQNLPTN